MAVGMKASPRSESGNIDGSQVAMGILVQTPANIMQPYTIAYIAAIRAVGNDGEHINGSAAKSASGQTGKYNSDGTCIDRWRFWSLVVRARVVSPTQQMTETTKRDH